ncbi:HD domain-containing protein [Xylanibacillus composti]|uniref:bis(5'-nucleosyl)-tetraphosphatase (symmetrical) n=1 Tax=Xylanibacillus composti TaxID=1572762 RepID=A0A8J4H2L2_9BACL|nr:bis(5'-nucleosyl)-tetraphosphatase (symmetrical) YqeK [Xylanibacillus composti]MDT9724472.1 HD domain-containing protein [Xylanibacillus composti]GIQ69734.1 hypothetical protein XYCOK13_25580 [Xylanibacillus composti]
MKPDLQAVMESVRAQMPEKRWQHTIGVRDTAIRLSLQYGADPVQAEWAAVLHDVAKYWPVEKQRQTLVDAGEQEPWLQYDKPLWHAPAGAIVAERQYSVTDSMILDAIRYHTSGRPGMTLLDKVVCLADYMEPGRAFPGVDRIRELAERSLEAALIAGFEGTIGQLIEQGAPIFPMTVLARNSLLEELDAARQEKKEEGHS